MGQLPWLRVKRQTAVAIPLRTAEDPGSTRSSMDGPCVFADPPIALVEAQEGSHVYRRGPSTTGRTQQ